MQRTFTADEWDAYAQRYDVLNELRPYVRVLNTVIRLVTGIDAPLLDAGCGTGNLLAKLTRSNRATVGIDSSRAMLNCARAKCPSICFRTVDLNRTLPFASNCFAVVVCINALYALNDPRRTLREFFRVLRPRGKLVIVTPRHGYENGLILKEHSGSTEPDTFWENAHSEKSRESALIQKAFADVRLAGRFVEVARINRRIAQNRSFVFYRRIELASLVQRCGFDLAHIAPIYARQNLLVVARARKRTSCKSA
jgi:ubiquinone/menaquinone biosynthesis C-methylase UbiE